MNDRRRLMRNMFPLMFLGSFLVGGCFRQQFTPEQVLTDFVLDSKPAASVRNLRGKYIAQHEWTAWLRFDAGSEDRGRILKALDAGEVDRSEFARIARDFDEAPLDLRPPKQWAYKCHLYEGTSSKGVASYIVINDATGETLIGMQQE